MSPAGDYTVQTALDAIADALGALLEYAKGKTHNAVAIANGATDNRDLVTAGYSRLVLLARMTATASGDLDVIVSPYEDDGTTVFGSGTTAGPYDETGGPTFGSGVAQMRRSMTLRGIDKVRVGVKNSNVASQTATCTYYLQR